MGDLGDLLELASNARGSYLTLRGVVRQWTHVARSHEAHRRAFERQPGTGQAVALIGTGEASPQPDVYETFTRIWLELPDRARTEQDCSSVDLPDQLVVIDGETWWSYSSEFGAMTNKGDPTSTHGLPIGGEMLDPARMLVGHDVERAGRATVAGRTGFRVRLGQRAGGPMIFSDHDLALLFVGDAQELVIDSEYGIALRKVALIDGEPFTLTEFTEVAFDELLDPELFRFRLPEGEPLMDPSGTRHGPRALHDVAAEAPFTVFVARKVPEMWRLTCFLQPANERAGWPATVMLHYASNDAAVQVNVNQTASTGADRGPAPDGTDWREVTRGGASFLAWEPSPVDWPMARLVTWSRSGTDLTLTSSDLDVEQLIALAERFVPAPTDPPSL